MARGARLPGGAWSKRDWALAQAVEMLDRTRCSGCGQPTWLSHDKEFRALWRATAERCFACDAQASKQGAFTGENTHNASAIHYRTQLAGY